MKIIDILNDYANGKIKEGFKFRSGNYNWVIEEDGIHSINQYSNYDDMGDYVYFEDCFDLSNLNDEVEIIEEKPEPLEHIYTGDRYLFASKDNGMTKEDRKQLDSYFRVLLLSHDVLVNAVNYLLEKDNNG